MNKNILITAKSIADEKNLCITSVFSALESAIALLLNKDYGLTNSIRILINHKTGYYRCFRLWMVSDKKFTNPNASSTIHISIAQSINPNLRLYDMIEEQIEIPEFDESELKEYANKFLPKSLNNPVEKLFVSKKNYVRKIGTLVSGTVQQIENDYILIKSEDDTQFVLLKEEMLPQEVLKINQNIKAYLYKIKKVEEGDVGRVLFVSRTRVEFLIQLLKMFIPEIKEGIIFIRGIARNIGSRTKIAVDSIDEGVDAIGSCIGVRGARIQDISSMLSGEKIDIVPWNNNPIQFAIYAMAPSIVSSILLYPNSRSMDITISETKLPTSVGKLGENVRLASQLIGWNINITMESFDIFEEENNSLVTEEISSNSLPQYISPIFQKVSTYQCNEIKNIIHKDNKNTKFLVNELKKLISLHRRSHKEIQNALFSDRESAKSLS